MKLEGTSLIGAARASKSGKSTRALNPATGDSLEPGYHWASSADVDRAAKLADDAFHILRALPDERRSLLLRAIADCLETALPAIESRATAETALPAGRIQGEMARTCGQLRMFARLIDDGWWLDARIDRADPSRAPLPKPDVRSLMRPLGPVAVFSSSNFPLAFSVAGGDTASALAAGCPVIVKPHQGHLGTSELVGQVVREAVARCDLPEGTFSMLYGPGRDVGIALVKHPLIQAVGFTGSRAGGRALMDAAAARPAPIPVYAEMGSINPVFLFPHALAARGSEIAKGLHASVTLGVGQFCTNPGLVFCQGGPHADAFVEALKALQAATPGGNMLTTDIAGEYAKNIDRFASVSGVTCLVRNPAAGATGSACCGAALFATDGDTFLKTPALLDEVFGPSTLIVRTSSAEQMNECARLLDGQLTATLHADADDLLAGRHLLAILEIKAGRIVWNGFPTGVEVCHSMHHGGPYPATSEGRSTSVGTRAITRFLRPVCYQNTPDALLPEALREANPLGIARLVDGSWTQG